MLFSRTNKSCEGFLLCGDYHDLRAAHEAVHEIVRQSPPLNSQRGIALGEFVLGLAYDIRKAYEQQREAIKLEGATGSENVTYYGVDVAFPYIILQLGALRWAAAFTTVSRQHQSVLYALEALTEDALFHFDASVSQQIMNRITSFGEMLQSQNIDDVMQEIHNCWINNNKRKIGELPTLLSNVTMIPSIREILEGAPRIKKK
jgi:hypothetical protein